MAVIFDVDGTLIDSVDLHARAWVEALQQFGVRAKFDEVRAQIGKGGDQLLPVFLSQDQIALRGKAIEEFRGQLWQSQYMKRVRPFPAVRELFRELLQRGQKLALASSAKGEELELYKTLVHVEDLIDAETSSDDAARSKPHPDIFAAAWHRLGRPPLRECVVVGDTPWDAIAAHRMGLRAVGVLCGGFAEADLRSAGCVAILRDPAHLLASVDQLTALLEPTPQT